MFTQIFGHRDKDLQYIYAIRLIRELVNKLLIFFLPLYFFGLQLPFLQAFDLTPLQIGIISVALFYFVDELASMLSAIPVSQLLLKFGIQHGFLMGHLSYSLVILFLYLSKLNPYWAFAAVVIDGIQMSFFWNSYHYSLSKRTNIHRMGSNLGFLNFLINMLSMIAPALGGLIIGQLGYSTLFLMGIVIILTGVTFSLMLNGQKINDHISWKEFFTWLSEPGFRRLALSFAGRYFNDAIMSLWPLYIFLLLGTTERVGLLYSLSLFAAMIISYLLGPFLDKRRGGKKPFFLSGGLMSVLWLYRASVISFWSIAIVDTIDKLTGTFHWLFFERAWMLRGKGSQALSYFVYRQVLRGAFALIFWFAVALLFFVFGQAWIQLFIVAGVGVLLTLLVSDKKEEL